MLALFDDPIHIVLIGIGLILLMLSGIIIAMIVDCCRKSEVTWPVPSVVAAEKRKPRERRSRDVSRHRLSNSLPLLRSPPRPPYAAPHHFSQPTIQRSFHQGLQPQRIPHEGSFGKRTPLPWREGHSSRTSLPPPPPPEASLNREDSYQYTERASGTPVLSSSYYNEYS
ncbi:hypothetical protein CAPTEDRAFT_197812 [Capitella teleta]|uniref:Uncharacterized protein n=1 Tax=Capitella teleta TaxID=283909 RepID=R7TJN3_CAPTE|nr:hypothetical protein CAPTEDRAFT_197812 [Capitella teleta]|eukprot:ELT94038.1 hypothetical protein CAPTEDRAFT_197812 [Capitella teleta]